MSEDWVDSTWWCCNENVRNMMWQNCVFFRLFIFFQSNQLRNIWVQKTVSGEGHWRCGDWWGGELRDGFGLKMFNPASLWGPPGSTNLLWWDGKRDLAKMMQVCGCFSCFSPKKTEELGTSGDALPETASLPLKICLWKCNLPTIDLQGPAVRFRDDIFRSPDRLTLTPFPLMWFWLFHPRMGEVNGSPKAEILAVHGMILAENEVGKDLWIGWQQREPGFLK